MNKTSFGNKISELRKKQGFNQSELAEKLNVTNKAVSRWETGEGYPEITLLVPLANALGTTVDDLLGNEEIEIVDSKKMNVYHIFLIGTVLNFMAFTIFMNLFVFTFLEIGLIFYYMHFKNTDKDLIKVFKLVCFWLTGLTTSIFTYFTMPLIEQFVLPIMEEDTISQYVLNNFNHMGPQRIFSHIIKCVLISIIIMYVIYRIGLHYLLKHKDLDETTLVYWNQNKIQSEYIKYFEIINIVLGFMMLLVPMIIFKLNTVLHNEVIYQISVIASQMKTILIVISIVVIVLIIIFSRLVKGKYCKFNDI